MLPVGSKKWYGKKMNVANKYQEVFLEVESNEEITSKVSSSTEASKDDVEVMPEDVLLGRMWVTKVNAGKEVVKIFG